MHSRLGIRTVKTDSGQDVDRRGHEREALSAFRQMSHGLLSCLEDDDSKESKEPQALQQFEKHGNRQATHRPHSSTCDMSLGKCCMPRVRHWHEYSSSL